MQQTSDLGQPALKAKTFRCMGTVISLTVPAAPGNWNAAADSALADATDVVERLFQDLDARFSLYRPESEASRLARGELTLRAASQDFRDRYAEAAQWRLLTEGAFTPERPDGLPDLSGLVKGFAIKEAGAALQSLGLGDWCLNAGGDVLVTGSPIAGSRAAWQAGIVDPEDRTTLIAAYPLGGGTGIGALATSGSAERGDHIWTSGAGVSAFRQVSVAAADIVTADVLATAIVAGGVPMLNRATSGWDVQVLAIRNDGGILATPGFRA
ncbi:FAD:protein FMN transferase [Arthrobacter sp. UKPF54-2]|uniref:FAD:protein FMN transferase n=1 Tax=Arthrobacter sp. UKPF54-2 TaxID=2600159 RepID=UPI0021BDEA3B|nr:FAD:protein FMN transferase [Arthrobacter sp. UKPF54-2]